MKNEIRMLIRDGRLDPGLWLDVQSGRRNRTILFASSEEFDQFIAGLQADGWEMVKTISRDESPQPFAALEARLFSRQQREAN